MNYAYEHITHDYPADNAKIFDDSRDIKTHSTHPRLSVGYDFGNWRIALDYARYNTWRHGKHIHAEQTKQYNNGMVTAKTEIDHTDKGTFKAESNYGISAIYDFDTGTRFKPYVGARVGLGKIKHSIAVEDQVTVTINNIKRGPTNAHDPIHQNRSIRRVGFGAVAGVGIDITPNLTLDTGYRYHYWGHLENTRLKTHEASLGVRYRF